ncbi:MAG: type II secretory pathway pseudopilin PulG [Kiritimatiellia bacterium]|jgi:type II secretory pathway pseudopilin PulG
MLTTRQVKLQRSISGFSILEMAIVMMIVSIMLGGLLVSIASTQEVNNRTETQNQLDEIVDALYGFAQVNGYLPCPATPTSNGLEARTAGACSRVHGFVPSATLGLSGGVNTDGLLVDSWLGAYRYSVTNTNGNAFTNQIGLRASIAALATTMGALTPNLQVCDAAACGTAIASGLPAVVLSLGADWAEFDALDVDASENSGEATLNGYDIPADLDFVSAAYIEDTFDDLITWIAPSILFTKMITAGQLP